MVMDERVAISAPPISLGIIILPWQRQLPTASPKALVSAGSGRGIWLLPGFWSCWARAATATAQSANNSVLIASLLLCWDCARRVLRCVRGGNMPNHLLLGFAGAVLLCGSCAHGVDVARERKALMDA